MSTKPPIHHRATAVAKHTAKRVIVGYRRQTARGKALIWTVAIVIGVLIAPRALSQVLNNEHAAKLYFVPPTIPPSVGQSFIVALRVQTTGTAINSVGTMIKFNPTYLEVTGMTTDKSFCTFYLDNAFDTIRGEVRLNCGTPNPGFSGDSVVVRLTMRAKVPGTTKLTLTNDTLVLANDGKGTNILRGDLPTLPLTITQLF